MSVSAKMFVVLGNIYTFAAVFGRVNRFLLKLANS